MNVQSVSDARVFAAGDCCTFAGESLLRTGGSASIVPWGVDLEPGFPPKAGVYAVREGPVLAENVIATLKGTSLAALRRVRSA